MKILKTILIITLICVLGERNVYSQTTNWDEFYTTTVLYDDFSDSQLDLSKWSVEDNSYTYNGVIIDSSATVSINSGKLKLSDIYCPGCTRAGETRDLAGGEVISNDSFQYGIFECRAKVGHSPAAWPSF